jgi:CheY-like chemotaxis protein
MQNTNILLVEDNPDHEALTIRALKKAHVMNDIIVAHDGAEALELLFGAEGDSGRRPIPAPQLILLDLKLPKADGLEVLRRLRETPRTRLIPVVVLTSSDEEGDVVTSYKLGPTAMCASPWISCSLWKPPSS